jgi:cobalt-zinc-cadmium efflux system outer membrane protein
MAEADGAAWAYKGKKVDLVADLKIAFNAVLADQQRLALADEHLRLSQKVLATVQAKVEAGKVSRIEETKARTALATSRIALSNAQSALGASRNTLSAFWGGQTAAFEVAVGEVADLGAVLPDFEVLSDRALGHPRLARLTTEVARHEAALKLFRAERIPDVTVSAGVKRFEATDDNALVAGVSIPLGLFDRRQGAIRQARHQWSAAKAELAAAKTDMRARLSQACQTLSAAQAEVQLLRDEALPGAREAFVATQEGYKQGKFGYLELLDAQKTLSELTRSHIDALNAYRNAFIEVERVTGLDGGNPIAEKP